ncbi:endolytic transglycosylase MltG [Dongia deserti]|uniref:endolytic transglycosylase MltG n=1 Tax=Dongia deserti TaxID=2268030 RepID=UPI000E65C655|nr:endolytic transglycosylase MltG [Dongia deserti]
MRRLLNIISTLFGITVIAAAGIAYYLYASFTGPGPSTEDKTLVIPKGSGVAEIAGILRSENVIEDTRIFLLGVRLLSEGKPLMAGEYVFPKGVSASGAMGIMIAGKSITHRLTIPEGLTVREVLELVSSEPLLDGPLPPQRPAEGALLPETYQFLRGESRASMIARMRDAMTEALAEEWEKRDRSILVKTPEEAVALASVVEKETSQADERARIAGVFYNRLKKGMPLQSDPTVIFAITLGQRKLNRGVTYDDLKTDSPYNTYLVKGLPPGPIANPGRAALRAVLQPMSHKELYFVADGTGGHAFAATLEEHNKNVANWRKVQKAQQTQ